MEKAEHIAVESPMPDLASHRQLLERWRMLTAAEPFGRSIQKLYVNVGQGRYVKYDANGYVVTTGYLEDIVV